MFKLSACIEMIFNNVDFYERFSKVANAGLTATEFWRWSNRDIDALWEAKNKAGISISGFCVDSAKEDVREVISKYGLVSREGHNAFALAVEESLIVAEKLSCSTLIVATGQERNDVTRYEQHTNIVLALKGVAPLLKDSGVTLVLEPLNTLTDHRSYYLASSYEGFGIIEEVGCDNIKLLYDIYHQQITEGNIIPNLKKFGKLIGHVHAADNPGRHEPGTGELNYVNIFKALGEVGYEKYVGLEYSPLAEAAESIKQVVGMLP